MDGHTHSAFGRLEVVETGRRRRWSEDEKARIVLESLAGPRLVSATARRHGISRSQLLAWHRTLRAERSEAACTAAIWMREARDDQDREAGVAALGRMPGLIDADKGFFRADSAGSPRSGIERI